MQFKGSIPALLTPMKEGAFDEVAFRKFVGWQIKQGSNGLVPVGTTGESPTLTPDEHKAVVEICVVEAKTLSAAWKTTSFRRHKARPPKISIDFISVTQSVFVAFALRVA